jgi:excisionase family DNA binding protein
MYGVIMDKIMNVEATDRWLSVQEISKYLGVSKESVYRWIETKNIPVSRVGKQWKFKTELVDEWVLSGEASDIKVILKSSEDNHVSQ